MAEARIEKWKAMKKKSFIRIPPDADSLYQHLVHANFLTYLVLHPFLKRHSSPIGHGWELVDGHCHPIKHTHPALPAHLPAPDLEAADNSKQDEHEETDEEQEEEREEDISDSECSEDDLN